MPIVRFPDLSQSGPEGILAVGGDLHPQSLLLAYRQGIFPWPVHVDESKPPVLAWFCPPERAILNFDDLHIPRSLEKARRRGEFRFTIDRCFRDVLLECSRSPRPGQSGTWITSELVDAYCQFAEMGYAHSVEVWDSGNNLVGGLYGTYVDGVFAGESMFHKAPNASKLALLHLVDTIRPKGARWIDIQVMTPHFEKLGAKIIPRDEFLTLLADTRKMGLKLF